MDEIFTYNPNSGGYVTLRISQSVEAFTGSYHVYMCNANGDNKREIIVKSCLISFDSPDLTDSADITVESANMTNPVFIDYGIFQGGDCANGKLFLTISAYQTVNGQPTAFTNNACFVVDPVSGYVESVIPTDSLENEGCVIYNGKLYISSHNGAATEQTTTPCFRIMEYSFD